MSRDSAACGSQYSENSGENVSMPRLPAYCPWGRELLEGPQASDVPKSMTWLARRCPRGVALQSGGKPEDAEEGVRIAVCRIKAT